MVSRVSPQFLGIKAIFCLQSQVCSSCLMAAKRAAKCGVWVIFVKKALNRTLDSTLLQDKTQAREKHRVFKPARICIVQALAQK